MTTVSAAPRKPTCTITADADVSGKFATKLGEFTIDSYPGNIKYGSAQVSSFDRASPPYTLQNTSTQVEVRKEGRKSYEVEVWAMTAGRKVEAKLQIKTGQLPIVVEWQHLGPTFPAQEAFGLTRVVCK